MKKYTTSIMKKLIIVESPSKIKTLEKFLGQDFLFASSVGHIRDLPPKGLGIDVANNFAPVYELLKEKKEVVDNLKKMARGVDMVYLSPDPDREGEAIAWHIAAILPPGTKFQRVTFNSITKDAVMEALESPRDIDQALVDAQQARRILDRLVGYTLSPLLIRRIGGTQRNSLSAGRVQSVALKLVVDREKAIQAFIPVEYWNIGVELSKPQTPLLFISQLYSVQNNKVDKVADPQKKTIAISSEKHALEIKKQLSSATFHVKNVVKKDKQRNPAPPFITSTLQQEASRHFGFSASRTMSIAQSLYEGVDLGKEGTEGLITYMRTDSTRLAPEAVNGARQYIKKHYGEQFVPDKPNFFKSKKAAQDAHEAIRPTSLHHAPKVINTYLNKDQQKLYQLIWNRFLASQMSSAIYDTLSCDIAASCDMLLRATGSSLKFPGFLALYEEKYDNDSDGEKEIQIPLLQEGETLQKHSVLAEQAFTRPPPRFTEASLVKELESLGIGRPSTYASIMSKIQSRDYTTKERQRIVPTELGGVIVSFLESHFPSVMDVSFTAAMEDNLEEVAMAHTKWQSVLSDFWTDFAPTVELAEKEAFVPKETTNIPCPKCGKPLQKIWAKQNYFYGCSGYPDCDYKVGAAELHFKKEDYAENFDWDQRCPQCKSPMTVRFGRYGAFLGCSQYPNCKGLVHIPKKGEKLSGQAPCPAIGCGGTVVAKRSRFGKIFFSCSNHPACDVIVNNLEDLSQKYPNHPKTAYVKKSSPRTSKASKKKSSTTTKKKKATSARKLPEKTLSPELATIVGAPSMTRPQVTKKMWEYIKKHNLQDPKDGRLINPDKNLAKVLGSTTPIHMFHLAKLISPHIQ